MAIKRVLFIVPPDGDEDSFNYETCRLGRYPNFPPYGLGVLAANIRKDGVQVEVLNLNNLVLRRVRLGHNYADIVIEGLAEALRFHPDLVGITCMFSQTHKSLVNICNLVRFRTSVTIVVGGVHVTNSLAEAKTKELFLSDLTVVDHFFTHESDESFIAFIKSSVSIRIIPGTQPEGEALNVIPAHDLITAPDLADNGHIGSYHCFKEKGTRFSTVLLNRGCRARCTFCSVRNFNGFGVRGRSVQSVIDELLILRHEYGVEHIMWLDDDFLQDKARSMELFHQIIKQDVGITWDCTNGVIAFSCTDEIIAAAAASGCLGLHIGMESGNPEILHRIKKPGKVETFLRAAAVLRKYETINCRVFLIIGFPNETFSQVKDTYEVARTMDLDWCNITQLQPLPNTEIFEEVQPDIKELADIKFSAGAYGKHRKAAEKKENLMTLDYQTVMKESSNIPTKYEHKLLWAYMNYNLNFKRLLTETRPVKIVQMLKYLNYIADEVAPDDPLAQEFRTFLQKKVDK